MIERGIPVGCISEAVIVKAIEQQRLHKTHLFTVRDFMESGFPTVPPDMDVETVINILQQNHAVLVVEGKTARGVITKHDLISLILTNPCVHSCNIRLRSFIKIVLSGRTTGDI